jgi:hypothetical protein
MFRLTTHLRYRIPIAGILMLFSTVGHKLPWRFWRATTCLGGAHPVAFDWSAVSKDSAAALRCKSSPIFFDIWHIPLWVRLSGDDTASVSFHVRLYGY